MYWKQVPKSSSSQSQESAPRRLNLDARSHHELCSMHHVNAISRTVRAITHTLNSADNCAVSQSGRNDWFADLEMITRQTLLWDFVVSGTRNAKASMSVTCQ